MHRRPRAVVQVLRVVDLVLQQEVHAAAKHRAVNAHAGLLEGIEHLARRERARAARSGVLPPPAIGLLFAILADRVRYESLAKSIIFMPMAISFIGAGIIWRFVYYVETGSGSQIGLLNAIIVGLGGKPVAFLSSAGGNNIALMIVGVWLWAGFCMTILSASLKSLPSEVLEAARVDGATEWQVFWGIMLPMIMPTVVVVTTTMVINVLKIFDIIFVMTGGNFGTEVIANRMFKLIVTNTGRSMAIAVILILLTIPIMIINVKRFREQEESR
jgi:alpha-glucoside transport system permease protein